MINFFSELGYDDDGKVLCLEGDSHVGEATATAQEEITIFHNQENWKECRDYVQLIVMKAREAVQIEKVEAETKQKKRLIKMADKVDKRQTKQVVAAEEAKGPEVSNEV